MTRSYNALAYLAAAAALLSGYAYCAAALGATLSALR